MTFRSETVCVQGERRLADSNCWNRPEREVRVNGSERFSSPIVFAPGGYQNKEQHARRGRLIQALHERDGYRCFYCGGRDDCVDHVIPRSTGRSGSCRGFTCCAG